MSLKRLKVMLAALIMTVLLFASGAMAESLENVFVRSAPLTRSTEVKNGMVRVWLESIGDVSNLNVTVTGRYSVNGNTALMLTSGDSVQISFDKSTGEMTMVMNGVTYAMGREMRLRRHQANGESAVSIAQASRPSNLYPGDLQLLAVKKSTGVYQMYPIVHVYLEYYLYGVVPYEMSTSYPLEALKAQAVAARTYTLLHMNASKTQSYDLQDGAKHQVYKGYTGTVNNATKAVDETRGIIIMNNGSLSGTYYTASNGGQTEAVKNIWGSTGYPYLGVKDDPFDAANTSSNRRRLTVYRDFDHASQNATLASILTAAVQEELGAGAVIDTIDSIIPHTPKYATPSRLYTKMDFGVTALVDGAYADATLSFNIFGDLESQLSMSIQSSKNELWSVETLAEGFRITVGRWGHGVGMSQRGAQQMAKMGYTYDQVLGFYFDGCERVQYTFAHTILPAGSSNDVINTEAPATITPADQNQATVVLAGVKDVAPLRYTAEADGPILTGIPNGSAVKVLAKGSAWTLVCYGEINGYLPTSQLVFTGSPSTSTTENPTEITLWASVTGTNSLNFRDGPGYDSNVLTELTSGTVLCILDSTGAWVKVQWGIRVGYVSTDYLTYYNAYPGETNGDFSAMVSLADASMSADLLAVPSASATVIMKIDHGIQVTVLTNDGSWCRVKVAGQEGYLLTSQLDFDATGVTPPDLPEQAGIPAIVNTNSSTLNLRGGPSTDAEIVAQIPKGESVIVTEYGDAWCAIVWQNQSGYVATRYLLFEGEATPTPTESATPTASASPSASPSVSPNVPENPEDEEENKVWVVGTIAYINLREEPSTEGKVITKIPSGDEMTVLEEGETFTYVKHGVSQGYAPTRYLTRTKPLPSIGILYVNTEEDPLIMRDEADRYDSIVLTYIPKGEAVMLIERYGDWCYVQYGDYVGYCSTAYLSHRKPTEYETDRTPIYDPSLIGVSGWNACINTPDGESLPVYEWCSSQSTELTTVPNESVVRLLALGEVWCKITFEGETGYCLSEKLILIAPVSN